MNGSFKGRIAVVTGGGTGIGRAIGRRFATEGAFVYLMGRREGLLESALSEIKESGGQAEVFPGDVCSRFDVSNLFAKVKSERGGLDILVNAAGVMRMSTVHETSLEDFESMFDTNVKGTWLMSRHAVPLMRGRANANIINLSSTAVSRFDTGLGVYEASKAAVNTLTKVMAKELAKERIRVNAIAPGPVETELFTASALGDDSDVVLHRKESMVSQVPFGRFGTPEEVARLAVFIASPESDFMSGSITTIDGGMGY